MPPAPEKGFFSRHKHDLILIASALGACLIGVILFFAFRNNGSAYASIYRQSELLLRIDLSKESGERDIVLDGTKTQVTFTVKQGAIKVKDSGCPSQYGVHQGFHSSSDGPIICAYNGIYVVFEGGENYSVTVG